MTPGKTVKLVVFETLQFAALMTTVLVVLERFARIIGGGSRSASYWLVVAVSIAYVATATLLVWAPLKYLMLKQRRSLTDVDHWRWTPLMFVCLSTLPCFAVIIIGAKVQMGDPNPTERFTELPVSLVLFSLVCVDITERLRHCRLTGRADVLEQNCDVYRPVLTHLETVATVSSQMPPGGDQSPTSPEVTNGGHPPVRYPSVSRPPSTAYLYASPQSRTYTGRLAFLWRRDGRAEMVVHAFLFWMDTAELVRVAGDPAVFRSNWVFPIYILAFVSTLRVAVTPLCPLLSIAGVALQDFPFFILRVALLGVFGFVTPVWYPLKNLLVPATERQLCHTHAAQSDSGELREDPRAALKPATLEEEEEELLSSEGEESVRRGCRSGSKME
ncbi:transmembrane protein 236-like [Synchiropus splendidus]|uniref:transmembrane protein 236-like n=1 Tax=Synchiropus splendidus TaxID=270530 RepID=UPI00237E5EA0|nr:transmembrane protein 236-like [Synchiropus splendidus]